MIATGAMAIDADIDGGNRTVMVGETITFYNQGSHGVDTWWYDNGACFSSGWGDAEADRKFMSVGVHTIQLRVYQNLWSPEEDWDTIYVTVQGNNYPIVLVHGFAGWGRDEVQLQITSSSSIGIYYWGGGSGDLEKEMNNRGFEVYTASVGPITSVWDRACELYSQVTGDPVNYGAGHAAIHSKNIDGTQYNHAVTGNERPGIVDPTTKRLKNTKGHVIPRMSTSNPIHLVAHSMGGQTVRMLATLLRSGSPNAGDQGYLFDGGHSGCIRSITTLATPNDGTNLTYVVNSLLGLVNNFGVDLIGAATNQTVTNLLENVYDMDLDQWSNNILSADISMTKTPEGCSTQPRPAFYDVSLWDLSPCGAKELNYGRADVNPMVADPNIYYFAYPTEQTFRSSGGLLGNENWWYAETPTRYVTWLGDHKDAGSMLGPFIVFADQMGSPAFTDEWGLNYDWRENDGVVNTISSGKPSCDQYTTNPAGEKGKWLNLGLLHEDHMDVVGGFLGVGTEDLNGTNFFDFYENLFTRLWRLPQF